MPKYKPSLLFSDCYASVGNITFFHIDGECYFKTKANPVFPGTAGQQVQLSIHQRGIHEWKNLDHNEQLEWNALAKSAKSRRLPADPSCHICGYNLFMSAYHGLACIGDERVPEPRPLPDFPVVCLELASAVVIDETCLQIYFRMCGDIMQEKFRIVGKIHLAAPGYGCHPGKLRNYVGVVSDENLIKFAIHDYKRVSGLDLKEYQVHLKYFLIDAESGFRSKEERLSAGISI